jgi:NAD(P)-dependent dehydrogenase (short-subunit alcohol dehydrogenase family)
VVATLRNPGVLEYLKSTYPPSHFIALQLDVTKPEEVKAAFYTVQERFGRLDVVFNNAGAGVLGEVESTPDEQARRIFDINFWGHLNVTREAIKFMREVNPPGVGGRIIQSSSVAGLESWPGIGLYSATCVLDCSYPLISFSERLLQEIWWVFIKLVGIS